MAKYKPKHKLHSIVEWKVMGIFPFLCRSPSDIHRSSARYNSGEGNGSHHDLQDIKARTEGHVAQERKTVQLQGQEQIPDDS